MLTLRDASRRLIFGLSTVLGVRARGFFIPYRHAGEAEPSGYPALEPAFAAAEPSIRDILAAIETYATELDRIAAGDGPARFDQDWFPRLDAAAAYALVRRSRPRRIVEIGSGHSTRFLARAVRDGELATVIVAIDPAPRATLDGLGVVQERRLLGIADQAVADLGSDDILFIDSSHVAMPGTDLDRIVGDVLPRLASGTLVHIHDIVLPDAYPAEWGWRAYNESIPVAALVGSGGWEIVFSSHWVASRTPTRLKEGVLGRIVLKRGARETSLWLRRR